ncbi:hypothetical protein MMC12_006305 [Toensbergia leucococca]|nr:hypothetical protein [Toensbergia leucococca]
MVVPVEPVSLTIGVVALASLFSTCVECWDYIDSARNHGRDFELLATKLEVEKTRLLIWGDVVGILHSSSHKRDPNLDSPHVTKVIERILNCIYCLFTDSESLLSRYGLEQTTEDDERPESKALINYQMSVFKSSYQQFQARTSRAQQRNSVRAKARWAIHDRSRFSILINDLKQFIDGLKDITESPTNNRRQREFVTTEIRSLSSLKEVKLIQEATKDIHDDWSDATSQIIEASIMGYEDGQHIIEWMSTAEPIDAQEQEARNLLLKAGRDPLARGYENLHWAADNGYEQVVQVLLDMGADIEIRNQEGKTLLIKAAESGNEGIARCLLENKVDVNARTGAQSTALIQAVEYGHTAIVRLLLENGADLEARKGNGETALLEAAWWHDRGEIIHLLLEKGADINAKCRNRTALMRAALNGHEETAIILLEYIKKIKARDQKYALPP